MQKGSQTALISDLSRSQGLSFFVPKSERESFRMRLNVLPLTRVFFKCEPGCRLGKIIPCFIQISFGDVFSFALRILLMSFAVNRQF